MPLENFKLYGDSAINTLRVWARQLNYLQKYIDPANIEKVEAVSVTISDTGNYYASTSVEGALNELGGSLLSLAASTVSINDTGGYYVSAQVEGALQEIGSTLRNLPASTIGVNDTGGYYTSTSVEGSLQEIGSRLYGSLLVSGTTGLGPTTYTLPTPFTGKRYVIYCEDATSSDRAIVYTGSTAIFIGPAYMLRMNFTDPGQAAELMGVTTNRWVIISLPQVTTSLPYLST